MKQGNLPGKKDMRFFPLIYKALVAGFALLCLISIFLLNDIVRTGVVINTDLRALLPESDANILSRHAENRLLKKIGNTIILLVGAPSPEEAVKAAEFGREWLSNSSSLGIDQNSPLSQNPEQLIQQLKEHRFHLLTPKQRELLEKNKTEVLVDKGFASIIGLQSWTRITSTLEDPLALFDDYIEWLSQASGASNITQHGSNVLFSTPKKPGLFFLPLYINSGDQAFQVEAQAISVAAITQLQEELSQRFSEVQSLKSGVIFHAAEAAQRAKGEVSIIGAGSLLGIIALYIIAFRSLIPLGMSLASILFGCMVAFSIVHYAYAGIHIITLVFGAALIGVSVDYSLHYFTKCFSIDASSPRFSTLHSIFPAITLGLITSVVGYGSLSQAPLPSLNQIALFSATGLIGTWLFVVVIYPWFGVSNPKKVPRYLTRLAQLPLFCWQSLGQKHHWYSPTFLILLGVIGATSAWFTITTNDDIRALHTPSVVLFEEERALKQIINSYAGNQFFITTGSSEQQVLENEENFRPQLDELIKSGDISGYQAITLFLPSIAHQQADYQLQSHKLYYDSNSTTPGKIPLFMEELGFDPETIQQQLHHFSASKDEYLTPKNWLGQQKSGLDLLWLGQINNHFASLILLKGAKNTLALADATESYDGVLFIDKVAELSSILEQQRYSAMTMLTLAYGAILILLILRYRQTRATLLVLVPLVSTLLTIALLSSFGISIGLFHIFAMFLILGLGMDYSIFIFESSSIEVSSYTAILFSAITSCLSFGLLALSSTPMVQYFGATILIGSILNLLLAPAIAQLSLEPLEHKNEGTH